MASLEDPNVITKMRQSLFKWWQETQTFFAGLLSPVSKSEIIFLRKEKIPQ